jgi:hypothetical protein
MGLSDGPEIKGSFMVNDHAGVWRACTAVYHPMIILLTAL